MAMRIAVLALVACSSSTHQIEIGPPPPRMTHAPLAGPLCSGDTCKCRDANADPGAPEAGKKRFEFRLQSANELWATVAGQVLYKTAEKAEACFYLDLAAGDTPVELRASNKDGVSAGIAIHELGTKTKSWYDTFQFACGVPGVCSFDDLDRAKEAAAAMPKPGLYDLCGSVKVKAVSWDHGKAPDMLHPDELLVRLRMHIYRFQPNRPHGDPECGKGGRPTEPDEAPPAADEAPQAP